VVLSDRGGILLQIAVSMLDTFVSLLYIGAMTTSPLTPTLPARAHDVAVEILAAAEGLTPVSDLIALGYLQGRIEAALELRRDQQENVR
jgi:hypothetical protein